MTAGPALFCSVVHAVGDPHFPEDLPIEEIDLESTPVVMKLDRFPHGIERFRRLGDHGESLRLECLVDVLELGNDTQREVDVLSLVLQPANRHRGTTEEIHRNGLRKPAVELFEKILDRLTVLEFLTASPPLNTVMGHRTAP